ncbi:hypothetical protein MNBD_CHLOROFLEXI01-2015 [hydrothermal vent metagenome]|uniref:Uncharacterized protein n=1 Tax=hydrothermal vent metagenome TaxID=652676 RepID=A0A3B0VRC4_9ZZZZ
MEHSNDTKTEYIAKGMYRIGVILCLLGIASIIVLAILAKISPSTKVDLITGQVFSLWIGLTIILGLYLFYIGLYFRHIHQRLPTFLKPVGLTLPIAIFLYFFQLLSQSALSGFFPVLSPELFENISVELLGGLITAWIFYFGFELYREEEQENEYKQLLHELKSIREEIETLKQQNQQLIQSTESVPNFITRSIQWIRGNSQAPQ